MEDFYRDHRRRLDVLLQKDGRPVGGRWNLDRDNRRRPPRDGLGAPDPWLPREDATDDEVRRDLDASGLSLWGADGRREWPVDPAEAHASLEDFVARRLPECGPWEDAMQDERLLPRLPLGPQRAHGRRAVPGHRVVLDFVGRHRERLAANRRTSRAVRTLERVDEDERAAIARRAQRARDELSEGHAG